MASIDLPVTVSATADTSLTPNCKNSPDRTIETFNIHTLSISTVYQSDGEASPDSCGYSASDDIGGKSSSSASFGTTFLPTPNATTIQGPSVENCFTRVERGHKSNENLNKIISEFCDIGFEYANRLQNLANRIDTGFTGESSGATTVLNAFRSYLIKIGENHREFVDAVQHECVIPQDGANVCVKLRNDYKQVMSRYESSEAERSSLVASVEDMYLQTKTAVAMCSQAFHEPPSVKTGLHAGLISVFVKFMQKNSELNCITSHDSRVIFDIENKKVAADLRELDTTRLCGMRDSLSKFLVYETARVRNLQYDMNQFITVLDTLKPDLEWSEFESRGYRELEASSSSIGTNASYYANYLQNTIPEVFRNYAVSRLALSAPKQRVIQRISRSLTKYIDSVWNDTPDSVSMCDFVGEMQSSLVRQVFCNLVTTESLRENKLRSVSALKLLARLFGALLSFSQRQSDAWSGFAVLKVSDFIYAMDESDSSQPQRRSLRLFLYSHEYWSRITFWEECLLIAIAQDMTALFDGVSPDNVLRPVTRELLGFKQWMLNFGINYVEATALIERVCSRLSLPSDYTQALLESGHVSHD
uniref:SBF1/SBF2 domain-containing protein n=2 Tax=Babesia bovis TaxID=5865 RepID=A7APK8_BABBO|eukprot:XP_001612060.1 hypothetical protein [Babesia bovis T2Bo]